ncbi:Serine/threonine-protein kinase MRCK gamma [Haplosporangium sp. Z 27]|nr:Serine/threonine-protein kinase MRCK gamma [Haplosporangium sp. Z 27]
MLKSYPVAPLGQNYTEFLESSDEKSLATFLQERLEKYKECVLELSQQDLEAGTHVRGGIDALVDGLVAIHDDTRAVLHTENWGALPAFWERFEKIVSKLKLLRINKDDFETIKALTRGQYGKVSIVRSRLDGGIYAMKTLNKMYILSQKDKILYMEERQVLAITSEWFPTLHAAFQDEVNLYLVMEYAPGGDLYSILDKKQDELNKAQGTGGTVETDQNTDDDDDEDTTLSEDEIRFYIAEIILAVSELHQHNYIHRDLKPQNILLDATGHIILADFGACARLDSTGQVHGQTVPLGTWDYMSPEVVDAQSGGKPYGKEVDWWAVGVVMYELLVGEPPFFAESAMGIIRLLRDHEKNLSFEKAPNLSNECKDLITRLLARKENRLGKNGVEEIKAHSFFKSIDWDNIRKATPPFLPIIEAPDDTSNFRFDDDLDGSDETVQDKQSTVVDYRGGQLRRFEGYNLAFIGYTYQTFVDFGSSHSAVERPGSIPKESTNSKFRRDPSLTGLDKEDVGRMRMEQEIFRLMGELTTKEDLLTEINTIHQALLTQYDEHVARATATESELSAKLVGIAAVAERERVEAEEATLDLKNSLSSQLKKSSQLEQENETLRAKCGELENEIERQRESILKQEIDGGKVSILKAENEELRNQKEHDKLRENELLLAEMERGNRLREENEALRLQIRDLERQGEQSSLEHRNSISELKKTLRGVQEDIASQLLTRKKLEGELNQQSEARLTLQESLNKALEKLDQREAEVAQLTKAYETAVTAMDSSLAPNGNGSVRTIYPSMLKRERASNKVLVQQLEEQGEKITELENTIKQLEQEKGRQHGLRSPDRVISPVQSIWQHDAASLTSPTKMLMELNSPDDISGWIRVSWPSAEKKGGKQIWKKQFIVLRDLKIFALEKEEDPSASQACKILADLRSDFFCVRTVNRSELIHASSKELECIFQVRSSNVGTASVTSNLSPATMETVASSAQVLTPGLSRLEIQAKIDALKAEIQKEEQIKRGAESIQAAWMGSKGISDAYLKSKENVDDSIKLIKEKTAEVERLTAQLNTPDVKAEPSQDIFCAERSRRVKELEKLITIERSHLEAAEKMAAPLMSSANNAVRRNWKSAVEVQMESSKQRLISLNAELEKVNLGSRSSVPPQQGLGAWTQQRDIYGHSFNLKHYATPKSCHQCHDVLWGSQKSGYECTGSQMAIIGAGSVGSSIAFACLMRSVVSELLIHDFNDKVCRGQVLDLQDAAFVSSTKVRVGTPKECGQADIIVITAGARQRPGETRDALVLRNEDILKDVLSGLQPIKSTAILILVANPVNVLTCMAQKFSGLPPSQVLGTGTYLDSIRFRVAMKEHLKVSETSVHAYVVGDHGDRQVAIWSSATVGGQPMLAFEEIKKLDCPQEAEKVARKAYNIIDLKGATSFGIAAVVSDIALAITLNTMSVNPLSTYCERFDAFLSFPVSLGTNGVERIVYPEMNAEETAMVEESARITREACSKYSD